jgi:hypothetical protein
LKNKIRSYFKNRQLGESVGITKERHLIDLAVACGRHYASPHSGFVHLSTSFADEATSDIIPLYENFLCTEKE